MKEKPLPPITLQNVHKNINWVSFVVLTVVPILACYGVSIYAAFDTWSRRDLFLNHRLLLRD